MALRCLTYNIHSCIGTDRRYSPERVRDVILEANPDIVALQEVDSSMEVTDGVDQLSFLANTTGMHAVIGPTMKRGYGSYGNAVLSRFPRLDVVERDLTYRKLEPRGVLEAIIERNGERLRIVNTHLGLKWWERRFQVSRLLDSYRSDMPTILMGDFNEWFAWSMNLRRLKSVFGSSINVKTFPSRWPRFSLDRIYVSPRPTRFQLQAVQTPLARVASDHLPVLAEVSL